MRLIPLTQGYFATVDDCDFDRINHYKWWAAKLGPSKGVYAVAWVDKRQILLHRFILSPAAHEFVDHKDGDGLNNVRSNLRTCTRLGNSRSFQKKRKGCTSKFRGVSWRKDSGKWRALIYIHRKPLQLGYFDTEESAASAYDRAAKEHFKEFASLNLPE